jgi:anti-anti-sigma factor
MNFKIEQSGNARVLKATGDLTIERAAELKEVLLRLLGEADNVIFDLKGVNALDLTCLQLMCSAHRTAVMSNKRFTLAETYPEAFKNAVKEAGYYRHAGCVRGGEGCLWTEG